MTVPLQPVVAGEPLPLSLSWRMDSNGHLAAGAALDRSGVPTLVLASLGRRVYSVTAAGQIEWSAPTEGPVYSLTVLDGGRVAIGDDAGFVSVLGSGGRLVWRYDLGSRITAVRGSWQEGILAGGWDERLTFLSTDGEGERLRWQRDLAGPVSDIATLPGMAVAATLDGRVQAFDRVGAELWHSDLEAAVCRLQTARYTDQSLVLASSQDGRLVAFDSGGQELWQQSLGPETEGCPIFAVVGQATGPGPAIVAGTGGTTPVLGLISMGGEQEWRLALPSPVGALAALDLDGDAQDELLAGMASGEVKVLDTQGRERVSVSAGLGVWGFAQHPDSSGVAVLAGVVAWGLATVDGSAGGPWLRPPATLRAPPDSLPPSVRPSAGGTGSAVLVFIGDIALGRTMEMQMARFGPAFPWSALGSLVTRADLFVGNLEGVLATRGRPMDKSYLIRAHPRWGATLVEAGIDVVSLANNHALDFGDAGLDETLDTLRALGIGVVGAGNSSVEARGPLLSSVNGITVAQLAYAAARWDGSADIPATDRIAWAYPDDVQAGVRAAREMADFVVVILHAGTEYATEPSPDQVQVARAAVDAGADLVVGHHPHVVQTVEQYGQGLIVYSLGDALFDIPRQAAMRGDLLRVHITDQGLAQAELWPFWIDEAIQPRLVCDKQGQPLVTVIYP